MQPDEFLEKGASILAPKLQPLRYQFKITQRPVMGSGGPFAIGGFEREERQIILWGRYENLRVRYRVGDFEFDHHDHMRALGRAKDAQFPGFNGEDVMGGFRRLLHDLDYCDEFLTGDAEALAERVRNLPPGKTGFAGLG